MKFLLALLVALLATYALGAFVAIVIAGVPPQSLVPVSGRPPAILYVLSLGPIVLTGVAVLVIKLIRGPKGKVVNRKGAK